MGELVHLDEIDAPEGAAHLILNPALEVKLLRLYRMRKRGNFIRCQPVARKGAECGDQCDGHRS